MKKTVAILLLFVLLVGTLSGCGLVKKLLPDVSDIIDELPIDKDPDDEDPNDEDPNDEDPNDEDPNDGDVVVEGNIFYPADWKDILNRFAEFGFTHKEVRENGEESTWSFHYVSEGTEEIDGEETEVIKLTKVESSTEEYRIWFTSDWECVKFQKNGEDQDTWNSSVLSMLLSIYENSLLLTQVVLTTDGTIDDPSAYKLDEVTKEDTELGSLDLYSFSSLWTKYTFHYGFYEDGDLYSALIRNALEGSDSYTELRITHLNPR